MGHRQQFALGGVQIVFPVGVVGNNDGAVKMFDFFHNLGNNGHRFFGAQSPIYKVRLHIHNNQNIHIGTPFQFLLNLNPFKSNPA